MRKLSKIGRPPKKKKRQVVLLRRPQVDLPETDELLDIYREYTEDPAA
jgi:hypothetical protein